MDAENTEPQPATPESVLIDAIHDTAIEDVIVIGCGRQGYSLRTSNPDIEMTLRDLITVVQLVTS